ncbi:RAD50 [Symbiodinium sp. CCMP2456]|nr:RAD50 [Symbiodinium sp. CCMP2456]
MDTQVPELMGVSRAVLENVIFCHQEESSWPLQEAASVKKRFDDIFGATRYTKALQNIKEVQRDWTKTTRDRKADADLSQAHLDQARRLAGQKEDRERTAKELSNELEGLDSKLASAGEEVQKAEIDLAQYESCGIRVAELKSLIGRCQKDKAEATELMKQKGQQYFRESLNELQEQARQFNERQVVQSDQQVRQAKSDVSKGEAQYQAAVHASRQLREDMGETVAAAELLTSRRADLQSRLLQANESSVDALRARLDSEAAKFAQAERDQRQRDSQAEECIASAERALQEAALEASKHEARIQDCTKAVGRLEEEAKTLSRAGPDLDALVRAMRENEAALGAEGNDSRLRRLEARQEDIGRRRHDLQYSLSRKSSEVAQLEAQSSVHAEVDALRQRLRETEAELGKKLSDLRPGLVPLLGQMPEASEAEAKVVAALHESQASLQDQARKCQELQNRVGVAVARKASAEAELHRLQQEDARIASELGVPSASSGASHSSAASEFKARLQDVKQQIELARKDVSMTESAKHMYEKFREKSRSKNICQFCKRGFCGEGDLATFEDAMEKLIAKIPGFLESSQQKLKEVQLQEAALEAQRPRWERLDQLRKEEMPRRQKEVIPAAEEERSLRGLLEPEERERRRLEERVKALHELRPEAAALQRLASSVEELRVAVRGKEARLLGANSKVSLQAERDQLRVLQEQLVELGKEEDSVRMQRDLLAKQQEQLRTQLGEQKGRLQVLQSQVARRSDVDSELAVRKVELQESTEAARRARAAADSTAARAKQLRDDRARNASKYRHDLDTQDAQIRNLQREVDALTELAKSIEVMQGRVENAEVLKAKLAIADDSVRSAERELEGLRARLEAAEEKRQKKEAIREALQANIRLKSIEEEVERHQQEISSLLKDLGGRDIEALRQQLSNVRTRAMELQKQRSFREGELVQTREAIRSLEVELASPLYAGVEQRHREATIRHESAALAAKDLGRYHSALDKALMKFHSLKMAEINKTIKELWQRVYRGRDIDYVAVRSDSEEGDGDGPVDSAASGRAMRSYNYRVVMVCGDAEMDMRGRCSAGQRVLCSLIIRLALADSFCVNCGVLALDEPTTNLDAANIRGLAEALANLIEARRAQSRFQLVLITHDEAFVNRLAQLQVCDWFYRIHKDESGCSKIEKQRIQLFGD